MAPSIMMRVNKFLMHSLHFLGLLGKPFDADRTAMDMSGARVGGSTPLMQLDEIEVSGIKVDIIRLKPAGSGVGCAPSF